MKTAIFILSVSALLGFSACAKSYACSCYNENGVVVSNNSVSSGSLSGASSKCISKQTDTTTCTI